jgi:mannosyltransferase OCH1-like enzyme
MSCKVPRIIHQIWMQGFNQIPSKFDANRAELRRLNPEWRIMEWDETTLRTECAALGPEFLRTFDQLPLMISKVDFGRYVVIYRYGGVSVDMDMAPLKPLSATPGLDEHPLILSRTTIGGPVVNNALFIACPENPFVMRLLLAIANSDMRYELYPTKDLYVGLTTGPLIVTRLAMTEDIHILDAKYFEPCFSIDKECNRSEFAIMDHQHELSWMNNWLIIIFKMFFWCLRRWYIFLFIIGVILLLMYKAELKRGLHLIR